MNTNKTTNKRIMNRALPVTFLLALLVGVPAYAENWADEVEGVKDTLAKVLNWDTYLIETTMVAGRAEMMKHFKAHLDYTNKLEKQGVLIASGPLTNPGENMPHGGFILLRAKSYAEARQIADADPMHKQGVRTYHVRKWTINEGNLNLSINFSDQSITIK